MKGRLPLAVVLASLAMMAAEGAARGQGLVTETASAAETLGDHQLLAESLHSRLDVLASRLDAVVDQVGLLRENALGEAIKETRAVIVHKNELGSGFALERARFLLDGGILLDKEDSNGSLSELKELVMFDGQIGSGDHALEVELVCRGAGFGFFSYVESYRFRVTSRYTFRVREGRTNRLEIVAYQRPDITLEAPKRLTIRYDAQVLSGDGESPSP